MALRFGLLLLMGCSKPEPAPAVSDLLAEDTGLDQIPSLDLQYEDRLVLTESLGNCLAAAVVDAHQHLCTTEDGTFLHDERLDTPTPVGDFATLAASTLTDGTVVLALDGDLYWLMGDTVVPIDASIPSPITELRRVGDTLWLWGSGRLYRWVDSAISEVSVPSHSTLYDFAPTDSHLYLAVPWLLEAELSDDGIDVVSLEDWTVDAMHTDGQGNLWFVSDDSLYLKRSGEEARHVVLPEAAVSIAGPDIWIEGVEHTFRFENHTLSQHDFSAEDWAGVDRYGRLVQLHDGQLQRHSINRPVVVTGLSNTLLVRETARLLPSDPESLSNIRVWLDATPLELQTQPLSVVIDPEGLEEGAHMLRFFCESELGDRQDEYPLWFGALPEVTWEEIETLSQEHCIRCHGGATLTDLSTKAGWVLRIDEIIEQVSTQSMPLGGPYLTEDEIVSIRGWKQGGFQ